MPQTAAAAARTAAAVGNATVGASAVGRGWETDGVAVATRRVTRVTIAMEFKGGVFRVPVCVVPAQVVVVAAFEVVLLKMGLLGKRRCVLLLLPWLVRCNLGCIELAVPIMAAMDAWYGTTAAQQGTDPSMAPVRPHSCDRAWQNLPEGAASSWVRSGPTLP